MTQGCFRGGEIHLFGAEFPLTFLLPDRIGAGSRLMPILFGFPSLTPVEQVADRRDVESFNLTRPALKDRLFGLIDESLSFL